MNGDVVGTSKCRLCGKRVDVTQDRQLVRYMEHQGTVGKCPSSGRSATQYTKLAKDGLGTVAALLALLYAWYEARYVDKPTNYNLATYQPRKRTF